MPSYEIKSKQMNINDFSILIIINSISEIFVFDLKQQQDVPYSFNRLFLETSRSAE